MDDIKKNNSNIKNKNHTGILDTKYNSKIEILQKDPKSIFF